MSNRAHGAKPPANLPGGVGERVDALLRSAAARAPDRAAYADPPNRAEFGLGPPKTIDFAEADARADVIAARLVQLGLKPGDRIAFQLPNVCETPQLMIGVWRAGLVAIPLPMMWRLDELHHALPQINPAAVVTVDRFAGHDHGETMREVAARHRAVRHILSLAAESEDGTTAIGGWFADTTAGELPEIDTVHEVGADDTAIMTWTASAHGPYPVPRSHRELAALGRLAARRLAITADDVLLNTYPLMTISSLGGQMVAALHAGATMNLHQPFDYDGFVAQLHDCAVTYTARPGPGSRGAAGARRPCRRGVHTDADRPRQAVAS